MYIRHRIPRTQTTGDYEALSKEKKDTSEIQGQVSGLNTIENWEHHWKKCYLMKWKKNKKPVNKIGRIN